MHDAAVERAVSAGQFAGVGNDLIDTPRNPAEDEEFTAVCRRPGPTQHPGLRRSPAEDGAAAGLNNVVLARSANLRE